MSKIEGFDISGIKISFICILYLYLFVKMKTLPPVIDADDCQPTRPHKSDDVHHHNQEGHGTLSSGHWTVPN